MEKLYGLLIINILMLCTSATVTTALTMLGAVIVNMAVIAIIERRGKAEYETYTEPEISQSAS